VDELPGYAEGAWWVQDAAAALPARLLGEVSGLRVLDLCAAPGGKTAQLAAAGAAVVAVDRSMERLERLGQNLARLKLGAEIVASDALDFSSSSPFDAVLLDPPCLSTGTIRRNPDIPHLKEEGQLQALAETQTRLLDHAARLVKPGGLLVYCTCSLEPEECELQAGSFLGRNPGFARMPVAPSEVANQSHFVNENGDLRTLPGHPVGPRTGLDGFFAARLKRL
jgi:16S rRNA (cytosine967-C5)-methyltransferase